MGAVFFDTRTVDMAVAARRPLIAARAEGMVVGDLTAVKALVCDPPALSPRVFDALVSTGVERLTVILLAIAERNRLITTVASEVRMDG